MTPNAKQPTEPANSKRKWNPFSKERSKSAEPPATSRKEEGSKSDGAISNPQGLVPPPLDSAYGSSGEQSSSLRSDGEPNKSSLNVTGASSPSARSDGVQVSSDLTQTSPTIRKETHHDTASGTTITTTTTTTTTTTVVSGPNGITTIQEPAELPVGAATPKSSPRSAAVAAAVDRNGETSSQNTTPVNTTPGQRPIPKRDPNSLANLSRLRSHEDPAFQSPTGQPPTIPPKIPDRFSFGGNDDRRLSNAPSSLSDYPAPTSAQPGNGERLSHPSALVPGSGPRSTLENLKTAAAGIHVNASRFSTLQSS
jgi:hypothetical protein